MKALITGAAGQLGAAIVERFSRDRDVVPLHRADLDIADRSVVADAIARHRPDVIVNCAAYNDVDGAETNATTAIRVNAMGPLALAREAARAGATFVHYSSDFVFDGTATRPYSEDDEPNPQSVYAMSKLLGEWFAADASPYYVLRVESLFGGRQRRSSVDRIVDAIREGKPARVFVDRTVSPSFVEDVADATARLLAANAPSGVYHCVNRGETTWHHLAQKAAEILGIEATLAPARVADVPLTAKRPKYCALANDKLRRLGIDMPSWENALERYLRP